VAQGAIGASVEVLEVAEGITEEIDNLQSFTLDANAMSFENAKSFELALEHLALKPGRDASEWAVPLSWLRALCVFVVVKITWVPFRSPSSQIAFDVVKELSFIGREGIIWLYQPS
jgi:hypothetical protein